MYTPDYSMQILNKTYLTDNVVHLVCQKPDNFNYTAGQFVQFFIPQKNNNAITRSYSICSVPEESTLDFCIKLVSNGIGSEYVSKIAAGETLNISKPLGRFTLNKDTQNIVCIATGVGIAPIRPLLLAAKQQKTTAALIFGVRHQKDMFWQEELSNIADKAQFTLSQPDENWNGLCGRVTEYISTCIKENSHYYICGNIEMVKDVKNILTKNNTPTSNIHFEIFDT